MIIADNMTTNEAATLSEKKLWLCFISSVVQTTYSMGPTVDSYRPSDLMAGADNYGFIGDFAAGLSDQIADAEDPEESLRCAIEDVKAYLTDLEIVCDAFSRIKQSLEVEPDDDAAGNGEVRFREPLTAQKEAA